MPNKLAKQKKRAKRLLNKKLKAQGRTRKQYLKWKKKQSDKPKLLIR